LRSPYPDPESVYGDRDVVTVVYSIPTDETDGGAHVEWIGNAMAAFRHLDEAVSPAVLRGVCHLENDECPLVWLLRREWVEALEAGELTQTEVLDRTVQTTATATSDRVVGGA